MPRKHARNSVAKCVVMMNSAQVLLAGHGAWRVTIIHEGDNMNTMMHLQLMLGAGSTAPGSSSQSASAVEGSPFQALLGQREAEQATAQNLQNPHNLQDLTGQRAM